MIIELCPDPETVYLLEGKRILLDKNYIFKKASIKYMEKLKKEVKKENTSMINLRDPYKTCGFEMVEEILEVFEELGFTQIKRDKTFNFQDMKLITDGYEDIVDRVKEKRKTLYKDLEKWAEKNL